MRYNKLTIDKEAEKEAKALKQQGQYINQHYARQREAANYNQTSFNWLFKVKELK